MSERVTERRSTRAWECIQRVIAGNARFTTPVSGDNAVGVGIPRDGNEFGNHAYDTQDPDSIKEALFRLSDT